MDIKYQIFVSSTFVDLEDERRKVIEQILNLGHIPVGMELFQAGDETQWSYIKRRIEDCDYYIALVAERYGSENAGGKSYTQMEYEFAIKNKIPTIAFLLNESARKSWPQSKIEFEKKEKVEKFRALCQKKITKYWTNADDLGAKVIASLVELLREKPRVGWIKASAAASAETLSELTKLSEEKRQLQEKVSEYEAKINTLLAPPEIAYQISALGKIKLRGLIRSKKETAINVIKDTNISLLYTFRAMSRHFALGIRSFDLERVIAILIKVGTSDKVDCDILVSELIARNLILINREEINNDGNMVYRIKYVLTDFGKSLLLHLEASGNSVPRDID